VDQSAAAEGFDEPAMKFLILGRGRFSRPLAGSFSILNHCIEVIKIISDLIQRL
jgi:hypothetical protein